MLKSPTLTTFKFNLPPLQTLLMRPSLTSIWSRSLARRRCSNTPNASQGAIDVKVSLNCSTLEMLSW